MISSITDSWSPPSPDSWSPSFASHDHDLLHPILQDLHVSVSASITWFAASAIAWIMISVLTWIMIAVIRWLKISTSPCFMISFSSTKILHYLLYCTSSMSLDRLHLLFHDLRNSFISLIFAFPWSPPSLWFMISTILWLVIFTLIHDFGNTLIHHDLLFPLIRDLYPHHKIHGRILPLINDIHHLVIEERRRKFATKKRLIDRDSDHSSLLVKSSRCLSHL